MKKSDWAQVKELASGFSWTTKIIFIIWFVLNLLEKINPSKFYTSTVLVLWIILGISAAKDLIYGNSKK